MDDIDIKILNFFRDNPDRHFIKARKLSELIGIPSMIIGKRFASLSKQELEDFQVSPYTINGSGIVWRVERSDPK